MAGTVSVVFLGPLRDVAGEDSRDLPAPLDWAGLLAAMSPQVAEQLQQARVNVACAGRVLADKSTLNAKAGEEVALLPPVSGG